MSPTVTEKRIYRPLNTTFDSRKELFLETDDRRRFEGVSVLFHMDLVTNIDSFKQLTTRIGRLGLRRCGSTTALTMSSKRYVNLYTNARKPESYNTTAR
ncbi:hypothetical protein ANCDUO_27093 [Ancylostoma duodenale]|uniref:Uncharacterized protein n=1 Tax=Ancylostoma duodenale TaxID=51022 RepID=A0A0C2FD07_9BILA|nr:hypothetical protein ANCDUO_27093 [Ancylostoma duodenale]